jgi:MscS family membrane protein
MAGELYGILIILAGITAAAVAHGIYRWLQARADQTESKIDDILLLAFGRPVIILILVLSTTISLRYYLLLPEQYRWILDSKYVISIYIVIGTWIAASFIHNFIKSYGRWISSKTKSDLDDRIIEIMEAAARYVIWFIGILMVMSYLEIEITPLLAGAGVAGLAIALAAQDIVSNFFGGAIIMVDKPFKIEDRIKIDEYVGDVVSIGPRSTRLMTLDYQLVTIPNAKLANSIVVNYAAPDVKMKVKIPISVAYGSDVKRVKELLLEIAYEAARTSEYVLEDPAPQVYFVAFGESSLDFTVVVYEKVFKLAWEVTDFINCRVAERFAEEGIEIPFKQIDIHVRDALPQRISGPLYEAIRDPLLGSGGSLHPEDTISKK